MLPPLAKSRSACTTRQGVVNPSTVERKSKSCILTTYDPARCHKRCSPGLRCRLLRASQQCLVRTYARSEESRSETAVPSGAVQAVDPPDPPLTQRDCY